MPCTTDDTQKTTTSSIKDSPGTPPHSTLQMLEALKAHYYATCKVYEEQLDHAAEALQAANDEKNELQDKLESIPRGSCPYLLENLYLM